ncbi:N-acetylneuraminic acid mutarotase [Catalinimonas alkaloidigena]|uniref:Kelch repeat-containing protein n=1 Tax=Catalinimonas alkaloidigena TaxID=1075417 RepID=UPI002404FF03|nr:kelch repeat-containing protein [Catalinimonas alkaloidigena]MDF9800669.1 N-acetylneuraminic acid mutarotase [Catalinimonas alkaloidigena]
MKNYLSFHGFYISILLLISSFAQAQNYCNWETLSPASSHRVEAMTALVNDKLYVFSGFGFEIKILSTTTMYDPATDSWTEKAPIPIPVTHTGAITVGEEVWLAGGFEGDNPGVSINAVQVYNTVTDKWRSGPPLPQKRASAAMALVGRKLHVFGGLKEDRQTDVADHYVLDLDNEAKGWTKAAPLPEARNHLSAATVGGKIYAIGGQKGHDESIVNTALLHAYDPVTNQWERKADLTFERSHFEPATFVLDGQIYIVGGRTEFEFFNEITKYSPETNTWTEVCGLPLKLLAPAARVINDQLYITHGGDNNVRNPLNTVWKRPIERNFSADMGFLRTSLTLTLSAGSQKTIKEALWVKSDAPQYTLSLSGNPSWITGNAFSGQASHEGDQVNIVIDARGLAPGNYSTVLKATAPGYATAELPVSITVTDNTIAEAIFLNAGGGETATFNGATYINDSNSSAFYDSEHTYTNPALSNILYQTERGSMNDAGSLTYDIPVANGKYTVRTHHAELYYGYKKTNGPGKRVFDISLESQLVEENVDLYIEGVGVGLASEAKVFTFEEVEVVDGSLTLTMEASVNRPTLSALEIIPENISPTDEIWLEAEEASIGSNWEVGEANEASGSQYITVKAGRNSHAQAPSGEANHVSFNFNVSQAGEYQIFARVKAPTYGDDSFWVKVNDGEWISWMKGVQTATFAWKEVTEGLFSLQQGLNTLTFAYREDGALLDKIHIISIAPSSSPPSPDIWLESECASSIGSNWEVGEANEASGSQYITVKAGRNSHAQAPSGEANHVSFNFNVSQAGEYQIFARVKAPTYGDDSFWVKVNDGEWISWMKGVQTATFAWKEVTEGLFSLQQGLNTLTFAYREDGALLDKVFITLDGQGPQGTGEGAINCSDENNNARIAASKKQADIMFDDIQYSTEQKSISSAFLVYPNPTTDEVKIQLGKQFEKGNILYLYDSKGVLQQQIRITNHNISLGTKQLPAGIYYIKYHDGKNSISRKLMVSK